MRGVWVTVALLVLLSWAGAASASGPSDLPPQLYLPARHYWQSRNNCGPTAVAMAASIFGVTVDPEAARWPLRPEPESIGMDARRVPGYVQSLGLAARTRVNGDADLVRRLLAADVPVVVKQWLSTSQRLDHFRLVVGYDLPSAAFLIHDSTLGPYVWFSEAEFMRLWAPTGHLYLPIYRPDQEANVARIVGADWDENGMYQRALDRSVKDVWAAPGDPWAWARLGEYAYTLGDPRTALFAWQAALTLRLPQGDEWLPGWIALAALDVSDYETARRYADRAVQRFPSVPTLYFIRGRALQGLGENDQADAAFRRALELDPNFSTARVALEGLHYMSVKR